MKFLKQIKKTVWAVLSLLFIAGGISTASGQRKYTNAEFYKNGIFQEDKAKEAVRQLILAHGELYTPLIDKQLWVSDFGLGDYEHVGLASVTWFNDPVHSYFAMTMYLLPGQMIPEHIHRPITEAPARPAKYESWKAVRGWVYNFSEVGTPTPNPPAIPPSFGKVISKSFSVMKAGETQPLKKTETWHFMMAGPEGAIVDEYGVHHDRRGWFSSNPKAHPTKKL